MKIGFLGLGKLGLPCALAIDMKGHDVIGYDINPNVLQKDHVPYREAGPNGEPSILPILQKSRLRFAKTVRQVVEESDIIFVPIQTPHEERYEGTTRLPEERKDFIYRWLVDGIRELSDEIAAVGQDKIVVIISTVLPGTMRKHIFPILNKHVKICYNPFFIAMGTTMKDFLCPEFVLLGVRDEEAAKRVEEFYKTVISAPVYRTSIENAEAIKVAYNTYISMKITFQHVDGDLPQDSGDGRGRGHERDGVCYHPHHEPQVPQGGHGRRRRLPSSRQHRFVVARARTGSQLRLFREHHESARVSNRVAREADGEL
jgi:UDPglucose 6-dehydrogenase